MKSLLRQSLTKILLLSIYSESELDESYQWLIKLSKLYDLSEFWQLPTDWVLFRQDLQRQLSYQSYQFHQPKSILIKNNSYLLWSFTDTLLLRSMSQVFAKNIPQDLLWQRNTEQDYHEKLARKLLKSIKQYVAIYPKSYAYVAHLELNTKNIGETHHLAQVIAKKLNLHKKVKTLLQSYLHQCHQFSYDKTHLDPLAPLLTQVILTKLDIHMRYSQYFYARHFGEWLLSAPTKSKLEKAIDLNNKGLKKLGLKVYTYPRVINSLKSGVHFMGYNFTNQLFEIATEAHHNRDKHLLLYYQKDIDDVDIEHYLNCWQRWVNAGLFDCPGFDETQILNNKKPIKIPKYIHWFLKKVIWIKIPLIIGLTLSIGIFLDNFLIEMLNDVLNIAKHLKNLMNPSRW